MNINEITISQLQTTPIWVFETRDNSDILIEPSNRTEINEGVTNPPESYIVYSSFVAADGQEFLGFCSPEDPSGLDYVQPVIIHEGKYLEMFPNRSLAAVEQKAFLDALETTAEKLFPLKCLPVAKIDGIVVEITILDFERMKTNYWDILSNANGT